MSEDIPGGRTPVGARSDYEVGYGKPPKTGQFRKGESGNLDGRPNGAKNRPLPSHEEPLKDIIRQEAYRKISLNDGQQEVTMPMAQAVIRSIAVKAGKGDPRSQRLFADLLSRVEQADKATNEAYLEAMIEYKVSWEHELDRRKQMNIVAPDPIPHPDHIQIDFVNGVARVIGPFTKEEKVHYDNLVRIRSECEACLKMLMAELDAQDSRQEQDRIEHQIKSFRSVLKKVNKELGRD